MQEKAPIGYLVNKISNILKRSADENLVSENMTVEQLMVMKMIHENGGSVGQKEIEKEFGVRRSTVTSAMQILEKKGFIERSPSPHDSRAKIVTLTSAGEEKNAKLINFIKMRDKRFLSPLNESERETLSALLLKLLKNTEKE